MSDIRSKVPTDAYRENYEKIFGQKKATPKDAAELLDEVWVNEGLQRKDWEGNTKGVTP